MTTRCKHRFAAYTFAPMSFRTLILAGILVLSAPAMAKRSTIDSNDVRVIDGDTIPRLSSTAGCPAGGALMRLRHGEQPAKRNAS